MASMTSRLKVKVASWALRVSVSSSKEASSSRRPMSRPAVSDASPTTSHDGMVGPGTAHPRPLGTLAREHEGRHSGDLLGWAGGGSTGKKAVD